MDWSQQPVRLPTVPGQLQATMETVEGLVNKLNKLLLQQIGDNLNQAIANLNLSLVTARGALLAERTIWLVTPIIWSRRIPCRPSSSEPRSRK